MIRRPPRSTLDRSSAASDVYKRQSYDSPANGATGVATGGVTLSWNGGLWAHNYDVYFGTNPNPPLLAADRRLGPSQSSSEYRVFGLPALQPGTCLLYTSPSPRDS